MRCSGTGKRRGMISDLMLFRCFASETRQFDKPTVRGRVQPARLRGSEVREVGATTIGAETALPAIPQSRGRWCLPEGADPRESKMRNEK